MELLKCDLESVLRRVPKEVRDLMQEEGFILAGGFIRATIAREAPSDIDLFGSTLTQLKRCADSLATLWNGKLHETDNALTIISTGHPVVQFITRWTFPAPQLLLASFDFTIAQAAIWWSKGIGTIGLMNDVGEAVRFCEGWNSGCSDRFYPDLASKRLYYTSPVRDEESGGSMMRVRKFLGKGYHIEAESLGRVIARIIEKIDIERVGRADLIQTVIGALREVDPLTIINGIPTTEEE